MSLPAISINRQLGLAASQEQGGVDIRNPSTAHFCISSVDRYLLPQVPANNQFINGEKNPNNLTVIPTNPFDFTIESKASLLNGFFTRLAVNEVQFRWTLPTLTARNKYIYLLRQPGGRGAVTAISGSGSAVTFTMADTTGYAAAQTITIGNSSTGWNGTYTITSTTATTIVCASTLTYPTSTATIAIRYLITLAEGWYDNSGTTANVSLAPTLAAAINTAIGGGATYTVTYAATGAANPTNMYIATSSGSDTFWFQRYNDPSEPGRVTLFEMMAWSSTQVAGTVQYGSPNASLLSSAFVDITCDQLTYNQSLKDADTGVSRNLLCRIFIVPDAFTGNVAGLGSAPILVHRVFPFPKQIKWNANQPLGNLRFQVWDSQGYLLGTKDNVVTTSNTQYADNDMGDWTMNLLVSEV
jgi:hypothetical protein